MKIRVETIKLRMQGVTRKEAEKRAHAIANEIAHKLIAQRLELPAHTERMTLKGSK